ncbi:MAG: threonine--tRNA ligase [Candidatus Pacebacteria bacterium]|nr:threonine--tRNA ligase [Candidatus Paceibacterota bacterium]
MDKETLAHLRHTLAHLLAQSVIEHHPFAKLTLGPAVDDGFYYDVDFGTVKITEEELHAFEKTMRKNLKSWTVFTHKEVSPQKAFEIFVDNEYKTELINDIAERGETITLYTCGGFTDLCRGGHLENPAKEIPTDCFKLDRIAGAYWRGNEKNPMLTRIYGLAFESKEKLEEYEALKEEAKRRDHRKLGEELQLFSFSEYVGPGLPLWLPNGTVIIEELEKLAKETEFSAGYKRVRTPHIAKEEMYLTSGHLPYYEESMYPAMEYEGGKYYLKAMNCPHHHQIFAAHPKSYRDLPLRLAEYGACYRHEKSGELFGIMRVRSLQMNDAHIYCTKEQFGDEFRAVNDMYLKYFKIFGIDTYIMRFSTHDPAKLGEKYVNDPVLWIETEKMVRDVLVESNIPFIEVPDEAAFYGPKIDVQVWSAIGREFTLATNQVDFAVPGRFGLSYKSHEGKDETPLCIHRAPLGTHERFSGFLIEHYAGNFPTWLSPTQVAIVPVRESHIDFAKNIEKVLREKYVRTQIFDDNNSLGKRIHVAKATRAPYVIVIGDKEVVANAFTIEKRDGTKLEHVTLDEFMSTLVKEITSRS